MNHRGKKARRRRFGVPRLRGLGRLKAELRTVSSIKYLQYPVSGPLCLGVSVVNFPPVANQRVAHSRAVQRSQNNEVSCARYQVSGSESEVLEPQGPQKSTKVRQSGGNFESTFPGPESKGTLTLSQSLPRSTTRWMPQVLKSPREAVPGTPGQAGMLLNIRQFRGVIPFQRH